MLDDQLGNLLDSLHNEGKLASQGVFTLASPLKVKDSLIEYQHKLPGTLLYLLVAVGVLGGAESINFRVHPGCLSVYFDGKGFYAEELKVVFDEPEPRLRRLATALVAASAFKPKCVDLASVVSYRENKATVFRLRSEQVIVKEVPVKALGRGRVDKNQINFHWRDKVLYSKSSTVRGLLCERGVYLPIVYVDGVRLPQEKAAQAAGAIEYKASDLYVPSVGLTCWTVLHLAASDFSGYVWLAGVNEQSYIDFILHGVADRKEVDLGLPGIRGALACRRLNTDLSLLNIIEDDLYQQILERISADLQQLMNNLRKLCRFLPALEKKLAQQYLRRWEQIQPDKRK